VRGKISHSASWIYQGFPALSELPPEEKHDDRFAKNWTDSGLNRSASDLRAFVEDPDTEALTQVGTDTGDPGYLREVRERKGETVAQQFKRACPGYLPTSANLDAMVGTMSYNHLPSSQQGGDIEDQIDALVAAGAWTVAHLTGCYQALNREGLLQVPAGTARQLSSGEILDVSRVAQNGKQFEAIDRFLEYSLPDEDPGVEILTDPAYRDLLDTAVLYVWELAQEDYSPTAERREFIQNFAAGRPLTLTLVGSAWAACQEKEKTYERSSLLTSIQEPQQPERPANLDALSDEAVDDLYHRSLQAYARSIRGAGVLA
jgi:hypothetical protein